MAEPKNPQKNMITFNMDRNIIFIAISRNMKEMILHLPKNIHINNEDTERDSKPEDQERNYIKI